MYEGECKQPKKTCNEGYNECSSDEYCKLADGECSVTGAVIEGTCEEVPELYACQANYLPVCGCDRNSYSNRCEADGKGVNVVHEGE